MTKKKKNLISQDVKKRKLRKKKKKIMDNHVSKMYRSEKKKTLSTNVIRIFPNIPSNDL